MEFDITVNGERFHATKETASVQIVNKNHLLDHILIVEMIEIDDIPQPRGRRFFRELFDNNDIPFNQLAFDLNEGGTPFIYHDEIPQAFEDCYVDSAIKPIDAEWEYWDKEMS